MLQKLFTFLRLGGGGGWLKSKLETHFRSQSLNFKLVKHDSFKMSILEKKKKYFIFAKLIALPLN